MRLAARRLTTGRMMVLTIVLSVPLAFWSWRLRSGITFPSPLDFVSAFITIVAGTLVTLLWFDSEGRRLRMPRLVFCGLLALNILVAVWFTSVEWTWVHEDCSRCVHGRNFVESRFFARVREEHVREYPTWIESIAADLGIPCTHKSKVRWNKQRWLGGCLPAELNDGIDRLSGGPAYSNCESAAVRAWVAENPNFVAEFRKKALDDKGSAISQKSVHEIAQCVPGAVAKVRSSLMSGLVFQVKPIQPVASRLREE